MKLKNTNVIRTAFQIIILGLIGYVAARPLFDSAYASDFELYCPLGGLSSLGSKLNQGTMSCNMSEVQVVLGIGLIVGVIILGKLFCSYICPIGTITEWISKLGIKLKIMREMPKVLDKPLRSLKYILLFITLYYTMTSSELFCKEFDPYFASVNLFDNTDITLYFAIPALVLTIFGALFFRLFWCKYLCPLGAISNIFLNVVAAGVLIILFIIANALGAGISYVWLVAGLVLIGLVNELGFFRSIFLPAVKITRDKNTCTDCGLCDLKCPHNIKISTLEKVDHIDCTLCTDCIYACPTKNTLTINKSPKLKYLSPVAVVLLVLVSLGASADVEFTTIDERWGNYESINNLAKYEQTGLKNVKCYGSSKSLQGQLENVDGIYGLDTYARSHTVTVYYNPSEITETKVKKSLFTPMKQEVRKIKGKSIDSLQVWEVGIYGLFDIIDNNNLFYLFKGDEGIYGFETHFGEPVKVDIFYDPQTTNTSQMLVLLEKKSVVAKKTTGEEKIDVDFEAENSGKVTGKISMPDYTKRIFRPYDKKFNDYKKYDAAKLSIFSFAMPEASVPSLRRYFSYLTSHLSADDGIVRFSTRYIDKPYAFVFFDASQTDVDKIKAALVKQKLTIFTGENETKEVENPYHIKPEGKVESGLELKIDEEE